MIIETYQDKINAKIEYAKNRATQLKESSERFFNKGFCETTGIPMGQPILVGHHSERKHRNAIRKYDNQMRNAINDNEKSVYYVNKAKRLENNSVISSDDPEAIKKLRDKISKLEENLSFVKTLNSELRKFKTRSNALIEVKKLSDDNSIKKHFIKMLNQAKFYALPPDRINAYYLCTTSDTSEIKRLNDRVKELESKNIIEEVVETINGVVLKVDKGANRIKLFFEGKPSEEVRKRLKQNGYRWSPFNSCWQCFLHEWKIKQARELLEEMV